MGKKSLSIAIATFNSEKIIERVLDSIKKQDYPQKLINVMFIDGGSTDSTPAIAEEYGCRVINNDQTEPVNAKLIAFEKCQSDYLMYLDHDEVLSGTDNIRRKLSLFDDRAEIKAVATGGYKNPSGYPFINEYINEFGDPFSFFMYRLSKHHRFFIRQMVKRYRQSIQTKNGYAFSFSNERKLPLIELCAGGGVIDIRYFRKELKVRVERKEQIPHLFYYMIEEHKELGITNDDYLIHYSADVWTKYLQKIRWRIKNNIFHSKEMGKSGYSGRETLQKTHPIKKILFLPYSFLIIPSLVDSFYLVFSRRNPKYFVHSFLCFYTACFIVGFSLAKIFGYKPLLRSYDGKKAI